MIRIDEIQRIPQEFVDAFTEYGRVDWMQMGWAKFADLQNNLHLWTVRGTAPLWVMGIKRGSLIGNPEVWIIFCREFEQHFRKYIRYVQRSMDLLRAAYPNFLMFVEDREQSKRLMKFLGLEYKFSTNAGHYFGDA